MQINAEKAPFLTDRLKIWMLPTLALIKQEKTTDYVVGFDELGGKDDFKTGGTLVMLGNYTVGNVTTSHQSSSRKDYISPLSCILSGDYSSSHST